MSELLPCPFCGSEEVIVEHEGKWFTGLCANCGTDGPADLGRSGAIEKWNTRAAASKFDALRAQVALLDDYAETIRQHEITIAAQARKIEAAREVINAAYDMAYIENASQNVLGLILAIRCTLFAANAPTPALEAEQERAS